MSNKRDLKLEEFGISLSRYRELYYFCQQYHEKKRGIAALLQCKIRTYIKYDRRYICVNEFRRTANGKNK